MVHQFTRRHERTGLEKKLGQATVVTITMYSFFTSIQCLQCLTSVSTMYKQYSVIVYIKKFPCTQHTVYAAIPENKSSCRYLTAHSVQFNCTRHRHAVKLSNSI